MGGFDNLCTALGPRAVSWAAGEVSDPSRLAPLASIWPRRCVGGLFINLLHCSQENTSRDLGWSGGQGALEVDVKSHGKSCWRCREVLPKLHDSCSVIKKQFPPRFVLVLERPGLRAYEGSCPPRRFPARSGLGAVLPEVTLPELAGSEKIVIIPSLMRDQGGFAYHQSAATERCRAPLNRSSHVLQMRPITRPHPVPPFAPGGSAE